MKLATYVGADGKDRVGVVLGERLFDLAAAAKRAGARPGAFRSMMALIEAGPAALDRARTLVDERGREADLSVALKTAKLKAPLPVPAQMRDFSVYPDHITGAPAGARKMLARLAGDAAGAAAVTPAPLPPVYRQQPIFYITNRFSVVGPDAEITWPAYSRVIDFELEFAAVIGRGGSGLTRRRARASIFGYTIFNDFSARDAQFVEMQGALGPAKGKSFDGGNVLGPVIVTRDEVPDPYALAAQVRVNGEVWSKTSTAGMLHDFEDMIVHVTKNETIHPGEVFGSGTMNGGCGLELDRFPGFGDTVELEVERLGVLRNRIAPR